MKKKSTLYLTILITSILISCNTSYLDKDIEEINWTGGIKIAAGHVNYNLSELFTELGSDGLDALSTNELKFHHSTTFTENDNNAFNVKIDDTIIENTISSPITTTDLSTIGASFPYTITEEISPGVQNPLINTYIESNQILHDLMLNQEMTGASLNGGTMTITLTSTFDTHIDFNISIPSLTKKSDQTIFTKQTSINQSGEASFIIDMNEYDIDLTNDGTGTGKTHNHIVINAESSFNFSAGNTLNENDAISYSAELSNVTYDVIHGDFKQQTFNISSEPIDLTEFFGNFTNSDINIENIAVGIETTSGYGFPIGIELSSIKATKNTSSLNLWYEGDQSIANTIIINEVNNFGDPDKVSSHVLDQSNSNLQDLLDLRPDSIEFGVTAYANPIDNGIINQNFYAPNNSGFSSEISVSFTKIILTKEINFTIGDDLKNFKDMKLIANVKNKIPLSGDIQLVFKDATNQIIHTEELELFEAANVTNSGFSDGIAAISNFEIDLSKDEITNISKTETIDVTFGIQLPDQRQSVMIKGTDEININVGLEVIAEITSK